jgi:hypothetical protein
MYYMIELILIHSSGGNLPGQAYGIQLLTTQRLDWDHMK